MLINQVAAQLSDDISAPYLKFLASVDKDAVVTSLVNQTPLYWLSTAQYPFKAYVSLTYEHIIGVMTLANDSMIVEIVETQTDVKTAFALVALALKIGLNIQRLGLVCSKQLFWLEIKDWPVSFDHLKTLKPCLEVIPRLFQTDDGIIEYNVRSCIGFHTSPDLLPTLPPTVPYQIFTRKDRADFETRDLTIDWSHDLITKWKYYTASGYRIYVHGTYRLNLCNPNSYRLKMTINDLLVGRHCGFRGVVVHMGKHINKDIHLVQMKQTIDTLAAYASPDCPLLLETSCGQGTEVCYKYDDFAALYSLYKDRSNIKVCIDTCHVFVAGHNPYTFISMWLNTFPNSLGLIHYNDSKKECGSRVDRHYPKGLGHIGDITLEMVASLASFFHIDMVTE